MGAVGCTTEQGTRLSRSIELSMDGTPNVGETVDVQATLTSAREYSGLSSTISIPNGISLVSGNLSWYGDISKNTPISYGAKVKIGDNGQYEISSRFEGAIDSLYIVVEDGKGTVYDRPQAQDTIPYAKSSKE